MSSSIVLIRVCGSQKCSKILFGLLLLRGSPQSARFLPLSGFLRSMRMRRLKAALANCQLRFPSVGGIPESLWRCSPRAATASVKALLGPQRRRVGVGVGGGRSRGWSLGACVTRGATCTRVTNTPKHGVCHRDEDTIDLDFPALGLC